MKGNHSILLGSGITNTRVINNVDMNIDSTRNDNIFI